MSENIQADSNFRHLTLLRKVLNKKESGFFFFTSESEKNGRIKINKGNIIESDHAIQQLAHFLSEPTVHCGWMPLQTSGSRPELPPRVAIIQALNAKAWRPTAMVELKELFMKLPPVQISMASQGLREFREGLTYVMLYKRSINDENFTLSAFLKGVDDRVMLERRLKVLVLGYSLTLIRAKKKKTVYDRDEKSTESVVSRIFRRIRSI